MRRGGGMASDPFTRSGDLYYRSIDGHGYRRGNYKIYTQKEEAKRRGFDSKLLVYYLLEHG